MKPWRAAALLTAIVAGACRPAAPPAEIRPDLPRAEPVVRVGVVVQQPSVTVSATGEYAVHASGASRERVPGGERWIFTTDDDGRIRGRRDDGAMLGPVDGEVRIEATPGAFVLVEGQPYRGSVLVRSGGAGTVTAVNIVELESYLLGVVPAEIPSLQLEAVKAQAVAARTYAIGHLGARGELGFDFFATVEDQVYGGAGREDEMATRAVLETRGEVVLYDGVPILAYYHSTCGGRTASIEDVWPRAPLPYLRSVPDEDPRTGRPFCEISNRFRWEVSWTGAALREAVRSGLAQYLGRGDVAVERIEALSITGPTASGRAETLHLRVDGADYEIRGDSIRWALPPEPGRILNSILLFEVDARPGNGQVTELFVRGGGWGHGVGMCQMGAIGRAAAGQGYREILTTYYTGSGVVKLY